MFVVVGLGHTGLSCVRYLKRQGFSVAVTDTRLQPPSLVACQTEFPELHYALGGVDAKLLKQATAVVLSPGVSPEHPALKVAISAGIPVMGDIELFARTVKKPVFAITGSNAKSTVSAWFADMLSLSGKKVALGANFGTPALDLLLQPHVDAYVLELSSFQLEMTESLAVKGAAFLNISEDHLDRHKTLAHYVEAKQRIFKQCEYAIYNADDAWTKPRYPVKHTISFSGTLEAPNASAGGMFHILEKDREYYLAEAGQAIFAVRDLRVFGRHNWLNALAVMALAKSAGISRAVQQKSLATFSGLPHRCQFVREHKGICWYNDSKGTNVGATIAALEGLAEVTKGRIVLLAGGQGKGADFTALIPALAKTTRAVVVFGEDAQLLKSAWQSTLPVEQVPDLEHAMKTVQKFAQAGDVVLLSPACASLDQFRDYIARGECFTQLVQELS